MAKRLRFLPRTLYQKLLSGVLGCLLFLTLSWLLFNQIAPADLTARQPAQVVVDQNGQVLRAFADQNGVWRYHVSADQVSPYYLEALLTYEDHWFYQHWGVNPLALGRATLQWLRHGEIVSGGSTLTMQVARIRYNLKSGWLDKLRQMFLALQLEWRYSKAEILDYYLNHAPFGGTLEGVEAASRSYFGYPAAQLTRAQAALLAVLPQAPSRNRPDRYPERARHERDKVLDRLVAFGKLSAADAADAKLEGVEATTPKSPLLAPLLARRLHQGQPEQPVIATFLNRDLQVALEKVARNSLHQLPERTSVAILVMEHGSGRVVGYVGSADFADEQRFGHVDMVTAWRSPGSTLKPFIFGMALDEGLVHSESLLLDVPLSFGDYRPFNFTRGFSGPVSVRTTLQQSLNVPSVQVLERLEPGRFYARMQTAGADLHLPPGARPSLALALGGVATDLEHLVRLYSALGNGGETLKPRLTSSDPELHEPLLSPGSAWIIRTLLNNQDDSRHWSQPVFAVKTGTSYGNRDTWAVAVTAYHTLGVWVGSPDNAAMVGHYGSFTAVPIARAVAAVLPETTYQLPAQPETVSRHTICWPGGQPAKAPLCDEEHQAWVLDGMVPRTFMGSIDSIPLIPDPLLTLRIADDSGLRAPLGCLAKTHDLQIPVWPAALQNWLPPGWRNSFRIPARDPRCQIDDGLLPEVPLRIGGIQDGDRIKVHTATLESPDLHIFAVGGQPEWFWFLNGELLAERGAELRLALPPPGDYELVVADQAGTSERIRFVVEP